MSRYQQGEIEQAMRNLILDVLKEALTSSDQVQHQRRDEERSSIHERGQVRDPENDRRLKRNREAA